MRILSIGRFLSIDPLDANPNDPRTYNRYAYGNNNPYKYTDPDGRDATDIYGYKPYSPDRFNDIAVFDIGTSLDSNKMAGALIGLGLAAIVLKVGEDETTESETSESSENNNSDASPSSSRKSPEYEGGEVSESEFLDALENWLGEDYDALPGGRYRSKDGLRQGRYGVHETRPGKRHHGHFEAYDEKGGKVIETTTVTITND